MRRTTLVTGLAVALAVFGTAPAHAGREAVTVTGLEADAAPEPLGIDNPRPRLEWRLESRGAGSARRTTASSWRRPRSGRRVAPATSGTRASCASGEPLAVYAGTPLASRTRYHWTRARLDGGRRRDRLGAPGMVRDGLPDAADWRGAWIAGPERARRGSRRGGRGGRRGDPRGGRVLPPRVADGSATRQRPEQPGRVPRAPARADAAQVVHGRQAGAPGRGSTRRASPTTTSRSTAARPPTACSTRGSPTTARRSSTRRTTSRRCCAAART